MSSYNFPVIFSFLKELNENNDRDWFTKNKENYEIAKAAAMRFYSAVNEALMSQDEFAKFRMYRIYRDVRFSADKSPYKNHFGAIYARKQPHNRGSFYVHIEPGNNSFIGGGFWNPNKEDLYRIRRSIELEDDLEVILNEPLLQQYFGGIWGESVKTAPKSFSKEHERIELIRRKQFLLKRNFSDAEVVAPNFIEKVLESYEIMLPFYVYMTEILTTDENGESIL